AALLGAEPHECDWPEQREQCRGSRDRWSEEVARDAPDEPRRREAEQDGRQLECERRRAEEGEERRDQNRLEGTAVRLAPIERGQLAVVQQAERHQPADGFVAVGTA